MGVEGHSRFRVQGARFRVRGSGVPRFKVRDSGFRDSAFEPLNLEPLNPEP
jgi:hypothetical protein